MPRVLLLLARVCVVSSSASSQRVSQAFCLETEKFVCVGLSVTPPMMGRLKSGCSPRGRSYVISPLAEFVESR